MEQAQVRVIAQTDNVAGVRIPKFEQHNMSGESKMNLTGLGKGGQQVQQCRKVSNSHISETFYLWPAHTHEVLQEKAASNKRTACHGHVDKAVTVMQSRKVHTGFGIAA